MRTDAPQDYRYAPLKMYETPLLDVASYARPAPVECMRPLYAERMGYKPIKYVDQSTVLKIEMPPISFASVEAMRVEHISLHDETSPHYIFHSQNAYNLGLFGKVAATEVDLRQMCLDMSAALHDAENSLHP
nr:hypothetical protein HK105_003417 [Polyrhizophydium stewartii]